MACLRTDHRRFHRRAVAGVLAAPLRLGHDAGRARARILLDAAGDETETVFGESVTGLHRAGAASRCGRVALLGDAAWCASPVSGMGTTLSVVGAYVLAGELAAHVQHRDAFLGYERILRPYVSGTAPEIPVSTSIRRLAKQLTQYASGSGFTARPGRPGARAS